MKKPSALILILSLLLSSCSVEQRINDARQDILEQYNGITDWEALPRRVISWQQALAMIDKNLEMRKADKAIADAQLDCDKVYRDFIPMVNLGYYFYAAILKSESSYTPENRFNLNIVYGLPSLTRLPVDRYTRSLALFKAEKDRELKRRELVAQLWQLHHEADIVQCKQVAEEAGTDYRHADLQLKQRERAIARREHDQKLCKLLNNYDARWQILPESIPAVSWKTFRNRAQLPDELTQTMLALKLETARLQKLGVGMRYLPQVSINFYSPSLFTSSGGTTDGFFSGRHDVRMNLNLYLQLDTRMNVWSDWAKAKTNYELAEQEITDALREYGSKMQLILESWEAYDEWLTSTREYIRFRKAQGACNPDDMKALYEEGLSLEREMLEQKLKNLERECALIQEYGIPAS